MTQLDHFYIISLLIQVAHSLEEIFTGFHEKWYFKISFKKFILFEILFTLLWVTVLLVNNFPHRTIFQEFFLLLMFVNGVQHIVWWGNAKKYVPGLITAPLHILVFLIFYFTFI